MTVSTSSAPSPSPAPPAVPRYLLDSGPLAAYLQGRPAAVALLSPWVAERAVATSVLAYGEVTEYLLGRRDGATLQRALRRLLRVIVPYGLTYRTMERYARLRRQLRPPHGPGLIGDIDTVLAATALERGLTLVTTDGDFQRVAAVSGLAVQLVRVR